MAGLLGVVAAMQFAISIMSDSNLQADHIDGLRDDAREVFADQSALSALPVRIRRRLRLTRVALLSCPKGIAPTVAIGWSARRLWIAACRWQNVRSPLSDSEASTMTGDDSFAADPPNALLSLSNGGLSYAVGHRRRRVRPQSDADNGHDTTGGTG